MASGTRDGRRRYAGRRRIRMRSNVSDQVGGKVLRRDAAENWQRLLDGAATVFSARGVDVGADAIRVQRGAEGHDQDTDGSVQPSSRVIVQDTDEVDALRWTSHAGTVRLLRGSPHRPGPDRRSDSCDQSGPARDCPLIALRDEIRAANRGLAPLTASEPRSRRPS